MLVLSGVTILKWSTTAIIINRVNDEREFSTNLFEKGLVDDLNYTMYYNQVHGGDISHISGGKHYIQYVKAKKYEPDIRINLMSPDEYKDWRTKYEE